MKTMMAMTAIGMTVRKLMMRSWGTGRLTFDRRWLEDNLCPRTNTPVTVMYAVAKQPL
jgi:hypothetical protein